MPAAKPEPKAASPPTAEQDDAENPLDNMSLSEIIAKKYRKTVHKIKSPQEAAKVMIRDTQEFDVNAKDYTEGTSQEQATAMQQLGEIETDLAPTWKDLGQVKQRLWDKLHNQISSKKLKDRIQKSLDKVKSKPVSLS